jgi:cytochrome c oxidase assembly protein subunit 15
MPHSQKFLSRILLLALILAFIVVALGAYTRLSDAGLGCPDWPGCYGHIGVPEQVKDVDYQRPLETGKAWKEMIHRYVAGTLGLLILFIFFISFKSKYKQSPLLPSVLLTVVTFQALLGMWTVTMLLSPVIVSAHLIGGLTTLSLIAWLYLNNTNSPHSLHVATYSPTLKLAAATSLLLVCLQIFLGGWTSTNYAALACGTSFPTCATQWWPSMDFSNAFTLSHTENTNYEFGILENPARTAIQVTHRIGALILSLYLIFLGIALFKQQTLRKIAIVLFIILGTQVSLGILNIVLALPLSIAVLHNIVAAFLLLTVIAINHHLHGKA